MKERIMRTRPLFALLLAAIVAVSCVTSCNRGDEPENVIHLRLNSTSVSMMAGHETCIGVTSHENTTIKVADEELIEAEYVYGYFGWSIAGIRIKAKNRKGVTTILVTDHETGETETLHVRVTDRYISMTIDGSDHPALKTGMTIFLLDNEQREALVYLRNGTEQSANAPWLMVGHATYSFGMNPADSDGDNNVHKSKMAPTSEMTVASEMILTYADDADGALVDPTDDNPATEHLFIFTCRPNTMNAINYYLGACSSPTDDGTRTSVVATPWFTMEESCTGHIIRGRLMAYNLPDDVL